MLQGLAPLESMEGGLWRSFFLVEKRQDRGGSQWGKSRFLSESPGCQDFGSGDARQEIDRREGAAID